MGKFSLVKLTKKANGDDIQQFALTGLPTVIFFTVDGQEIKRLTGYYNHENFLKELKDLPKSVTNKTEQVTTEVQQKEKITFLTSLEEGKKQSLSQKKPLLVKFGADW